MSNLIITVTTKQEWTSSSIICLLIVTCQKKKRIDASLSGSMFNHILVPLSSLGYDLGQ